MTVKLKKDMEESMKFNSSVCTSIEQSQRLLELGLKPETADMYYHEGSEDGAGNIEFHRNIRTECNNILFPDYIPAWSLHRLIELLPQDIHLDDYADTHYYLTIDPFKVIYVNSHRLWIYQRDEGCLYDKLVKNGYSALLP